MQVLRPDDVGMPSGGTVVTIGAYDGVHLGHRHVLSLLTSRALSLGLESAVVTFDRHPATVVRPESAPPLLTDLGQKLELLAECGIDVTLVVPFDRTRASESAEDFVSEILVAKLGARAVVVGQDFHFGRERRGNVELLARLGARYGFDVDGVDLARSGSTVTGAEQPLEDPLEPVSSTRIRRLLLGGDVAGAGRLLGRPHEVRGRVVHGDGRGRAELGFPTANVAVPADIALPALGIYAGWYRRPDGIALPAALSVGQRPTFYEHSERLPPLLEAFLLDWDGDLYEEEARVSFVEHLRGERRYDSVDELVAQMRVDVDSVRTIMVSCRP